MYEYKMTIQTTKEVSFGNYGNVGCSLPDNEYSMARSNAHDFKDGGAIRRSTSRTMHAVGPSM